LRTAVIRKENESYDVGHLQVWDSKCLYRLAGDDGGWENTAENIAKQWKTVGQGEGPQVYS